MNLSIYQRIIMTNNFGPVQTSHDTAFTFQKNFLPRHVPKMLEVRKGDYGWLCHIFCPKTIFKTKDPHGYFRRYGRCGLEPFLASLFLLLYGETIYFLFKILHVLQLFGLILLSALCQTLLSVMSVLYCIFLTVSCYSGWLLWWVTFDQIANMLSDSFYVISI